MIETLLPLFQEYLDPTHLITIPVLIGIGAGLKHQTTLCNNYIPFVLFGIALVTMILKGMAFDVVSVVNAFEQAVIVTFIAIGTYSMAKNAKELRQ